MTNELLGFRKNILSEMICLEGEFLFVESLIL